MAAAKSIFDEGVRLLDAGELEEACKRFAASEKILPRIATLLNLGDCNERLGRTATAWGAFTEAISLARKDGRSDAESEARRRADGLAPRLTHLVVRVEPEADLAGLVITRDGVPVDRALHGIAVAVDPGVHEIVASAPGRRTWATRVDLEADGEKRDVIVPTLETIPQPERAAPPAVARGSRGRVQRIVAFAVGGAGVAALAVGVAYGLKARSSWNEVASSCTAVGDYYECGPAGLAANEDARSAATIANVMFATSGVAFATSVVLYVASPKQSRERPPVAIVPVDGGAAVTFAGSF